MTAGKRISVFLILTITAVVLCILPFLVCQRAVLYIYTKSPLLTSQEQGFIRELKTLGFDVIVNDKKNPPKNSYALWFNNPEYAYQIEKSLAKTNFLYTEAYYPAEWKNITKDLVIFSPYQSLYEHYTRSNIKSATLFLGLNTKDFYEDLDKKKYPVVYYGDNNKISPVADLLQNNDKVKFLGAFWPKKDNVLDVSLGTTEARRNVLQKSKIVVVYNEPNSNQSKLIPSEIMEATATGALVLTSPNEKVTELYQDSVVIYKDNTDLLAKLQWFQTHDEATQKLAKTAQNITAQKLNSRMTANRFKEIFDWIKNNQTD